MKKALKVILLSFIGFIVVIAGLTGLLVFKINKENKEIATNKVDYLAQYNELIKPANYNEADDANFDYQKAYECYVKMPAELEKIDWHDNPSDEDYGKLKAWLDQNSKTLEFFNMAVEKPCCWTKYARKEDGERFYDYKPFFIILKLNRYNLFYQLHEKDQKSAFETTKKCIDALRHLQGPHMMLHKLIFVCSLEYSIKNTTYLLNTFKFDNNCLSEIEQQYNKIDPDQVGMYYTDGEKLFMKEYIDDAFTSDGNGNGRLKFSSVQEPTLTEIGLLEKITTYLSSPDKKKTIELHEKMMEVQNQLNHVTPWQLNEENSCYYDRLYESCNGNAYLSRNLDTQSFQPERCQITRMSLRALLTIIGIHKFKNDHGIYPDSLEELHQKGYISEIPMDIYSPNPIIYTKTDERFKLYSVGYNFEDDGGVVNDPGYWEFADDTDIIFWPIDK